MGLYDWSKNAGSNTTLESISWAEGMAPAGINNGVRAIAAALKKFQEDTGGVLLTTGAANAYALDTNSDPPALADGLLFAAIANHSNTGPATLTVDALASKSIRKVSQSSTNDMALEANDMRARGFYLLAYDVAANASSGAWILLNPAQPSLGSSGGTQVYDAFLTSIAALGTAADRMIYTTGVDTAAEATITAYARTLLDDVDAAAALTTLGVSAFVQTILDDADASAARLTLGLGTISTQAADAVAITGGTITGITDLAIADGGTGAGTAADARTNLGLAVGTDVQAFDAQLTDIAALTPTDNAFIVGNGTNFVAEADAVARTSLGLGTAAVKNTGASGDAVPLLNIANTFSAAQKFTLATAGAAPVRVESTEGFGTEGPYLDIARFGGSPGDGDDIGVLRFRGQDSSLAEVSYAEIAAEITDADTPSADGQMLFRTMTGSSLTQVGRIKEGWVLGSTGIDMGAGTLNAPNGLYVGSTAVATPARLASPGFLSLGEKESVTIAGGIITVTKSFVMVDTQAAAATDDLDTINGGADGDILVLIAASNTRTVVVKDATGNIHLNSDVSLDHGHDTVTLIHNGGNWLRMSSSDNTA